MNPQEQELLNRVVAKDPNELNAYDMAILQARKAYLSREERRKFAKALKEEVEFEKPPADPNRLPYKELQRKAKSYGLRYTAVSREDLELAISTIEGPAGAPKPE